MARARKHDWRIGVLALFGAAVLAAMTLAGSSPERAHAAPCPPTTYSLVGGEFSLSGTTPCDFDPEGFRVFCEAGKINFDYHVNGTDVGIVNTGYDCSAPSHLNVQGRDGGDEIDLSGVTRAAGFTGITLPNAIVGSYGNDLVRGSAFADNVTGGADADILLLRDGAADVADCGDGVDAVQTDPLGVDSYVACELADVAPTPPKVCKKKAKSAKKKRGCGKRKKKG